MNPRDYRRQVEADLQAASAAAPARAAVRSLEQGPNWSRDIEELMDEGRPPGAREEALRRLQVGTFLLGEFSQYRAPYLRALQEAATATDARLRHAALDILANLQDDFARRKLTEGLRDPSKALVSPAVALGFLARDDHGAVVDIARDVLNHDNDPATRAQAVRILSADPTSKELIADRMRDKGEFREVRRASAVALHSVDPDAFRTLARDILSDDADYQDIKATLRGALEREAAAAATASPAKR